MEAGKNCDKSKDILANSPLKSTPQDIEVLPASVMKEKRMASSSLVVSSIENPHRIIRQGLFVIFLFFGVMGAWATFCKISGAVVAPGKVKIETERKTVQHLEGGIVEAILVREGDEVTSGQTLVVLESMQVSASVDMLYKQLIAQMAAHARHIAEKDRQPSIAWSQELVTLSKESNMQDVLANELKIFNARRYALQGQVSLLESQISQINAQISGFEEQHKAEQLIIATLNEELKAKRQLYQERYLEKSQILELERLLATHQGSRGRIKQSIAEAHQRSNEYKLRIEDTINRFVEDATNQLGRLENEILQIKEKIRPLTDSKKRLNVIAPVDGRIVGLNIHSKGGVVRAGEPILDIVPKDMPLIVETQVPVNKITDVYIGQAAQVQLDAFDIRITPLIKGKVSHISADRLEEKTEAGALPYYMCYVEIAPKTLVDADMYLAPGMPATVFITTKERTVLYYMFEPLIKNWTKAMRE